jgi:hypothetical protein
LQGIGIEDRAGRVPPIAEEGQEARIPDVKRDLLDSVTIKEERIEAADDVS